MEKLTCNDCKVVYTEEADIKLAKGMQKDYKEMSIEKIVEEAKYYQAEKDKATEEIASKGWREMIIILLEKAFTKGYDANSRYKKREQSKAIKCRCACHKTKDRENGTCGKCYTIQCSWWEGTSFEYANCEGLWKGKKERNRQNENNHKNNIPSFIGNRIYLGVSMVYRFIGLQVYSNNLHNSVRKVK